MSQENKILITRTDRLGDVLLTLPTLEYLRAELPSYSIDFLCPKNILEVISPHLASQKIRGIGLEKEFETKDYSGILFLFAPTRLLYKAWKTKVPFRVGPRTKIPSLFFLNCGISQHRSTALKHESQYNLDLAKHLVSCLQKNPSEPKLSSIELKGDPISKENAEKVMDKMGLQKKAFFIVHPGMGGSALNLSAEGYIKLIHVLEKQTTLPAVLSIGPSKNDQSLKKDIGQKIPQLKILEGLELSTLREVFRRAALFAGPSTGPLHLAHFVGTQTIGIFSPVKSQHPNRWAPRNGSGKSHIFCPEVSCPGLRVCVSGKCQFEPCMEELDWEKLILDRGSGFIFHP